MRGKPTYEISSVRTVFNHAIDDSSFLMIEVLRISVELQSQSDQSQRLVVDYRVHYVKKLGGTSPKVFKMKELTLEPAGRVSLTRRQLIKDFTTRPHYSGVHLVELMVNGKCLAQCRFELCSCLNRMDMSCLI